MPLYELDDRRRRGSERHREKGREEREYCESTGGRPREQKGAFAAYKPRKEEWNSVEAAKTRLNMKGRLTTYFRYIRKS